MPVLCSLKGDGLQTTARLADGDPSLLLSVFMTDYYGKRNTKKKQTLRTKILRIKEDTVMLSCG